FLGNGGKSLILATECGDLYQLGKIKQTLIMFRVPYNSSFSTGSIKRKSDLKCSNAQACSRYDV
ncbi:hypothetical protein AMELA_G00114010, partial [Ameiurus melas]